MMNTDKKHDNFLITTPIYYVNDVPHIGHAYTTIIGDTMARFGRLKGCDIFFLTGTDEHGQKIEEAATARGKTPKEYADQISGSFRNLWDDFGISYDHYIRTTDPQHIAGVQKAFETMLANGDIYKGEYEGHYCVSCETFFTKTQLVDDQFCPDCGKGTNLLKEESYFFRLSKYEKPLLAWYQEKEECILPKSRKNEVVKFVEGGLRDLSITRTSFEWGVKLPQSANDPKHVIYVWLDALLNYVTALGYGTDEAKMKYWPAKLHLVGKDILKFHAIYWPAFLMSLDLPLPSHIAAHGWWTRDGQKMSKSKGNVVNPKEVADEFGLDNFRYFLLREVPFGQDGDFSRRAMIDRINNDLANDLGNLLNRTLGMAEKYFQFTIHSEGVSTYHKEELQRMDEILSSLEPLLYSMQTHRYLEEIWKVISIGNKAIEVAAPWVKMKEGKTDEAMAVVALSANIVAKVAIMLSPVMPQAMEKIATAVAFAIDTNAFEKYILRQELLEERTLVKIPPLFPKIEEEKKEAKIEDAPTSTSPQTSEDLVIENPISIDDFFATQIKVGTILSATEMPKSKKLFILSIDLGESRPRQILAGIKEYYRADELVGTQVCVVANLAPAKIMGLTSEGMVLAAKDEDGLCVIRPPHPRANGSLVR